jgi:exodeoxyribonuclease-3
MKIVSWNVNGYRAIAGKGFAKWFQDQNADVVGLQEVKAHEDAVDSKIKSFDGYQCYWHAAKKPGYSGTAIWTKKEPLDYRAGIGIAEIDDEGRVQIMEFKDFTLLNCYFPNSQDERARLPYKLRFCAAIEAFCKDQIKKGKPVMVQGDLNVAHTPLDIKNAKSNEDSPGFYIEERNWMTDFLKTGMRDVFRERNPNIPGLYTWWSYRANARANNVGWRIDYQVVSSDLVERVLEIDHQRQVFGSDHCPVWVTLRT